MRFADSNQDVELVGWRDVEGGAILRVKTWR